MKSMPNRETLASQVYQSLRDAVVSGELVPGDLHSVAELAGQMNVSRTPVREALLKLADAGMVRFERNRGIRVMGTTIDDLEQVFSLRLLLEVPATYRATQQASTDDLGMLTRALDDFRDLVESSTPRDHLQCDARFHAVILRTAGNARLAHFVETLRDLQMARGASTAGRTRSLADIYDDHARIHERVVAGDAIGAARLMRDHIALAGQLLLAQEADQVEHAERFELPWMDVLTLSGLLPDGGPLATSVES